VLNSDGQERVRVSALQAGGKMVWGAKGAGLEDEIHRGRFKGGMSEDDSIWDAWQVRSIAGGSFSAVYEAGQT
jgi:hypothetical protein